MKQVARPVPRRMGVAEAKARLSAVLREIEQGPVLVHSRGRDLAVVIAAAEYAQLVRDRDDGSSVSGLLARLADLKERLGGGADDFRPPRAKLQARPAFSKRER